MKPSISHFATFACGLILSPIVFGLTRVEFGQTSVTVTLSPSDNIQSAVDAAPEGTTFALHPGVYRLQGVRPKNGDVFNGEGSVILNGSQLLLFRLDPSKGRIWVADASADKFFHGNCQSTHPLCGYAQDLFINNVLQTPASSFQGLKPGAWYFDRSNNKLYISVDPSGKVVELGIRPYAFYGGAKKVHLNGLTVEKYATPAQYGAVGGDASGEGWLVNHVESRWNHGRGISLGSGYQILNSNIHHNGQLGISLYGVDSKAVKNEISWNNYAGFGIGWEAGGSKFSNTTNLAVQFNYVHDNQGPGLWTDVNNVGTLYENNLVVNNLSEGIVHEISYSAIIRNNTVKGNGDTSTVWLENAQIAVQNSSHVDVYKNIVEVPSRGGNGIVLINQKRGVGRLGPWVAADDHVHDNHVTYLGSKGVSGIGDDTGGNSAVGNQFDSNNYVQSNDSNKHWQWFKATDWGGFRAMGQETHGHCCN